MSFDAYLDRQYHLRDYNCAHFVRDVWLDVFKQDIGAYIAHIYAPRAERSVQIAKLRQFKRVHKPCRLDIKPCIVLMNAGTREIHIGLYYKGRILHISESGVRYELPETIEPLFKKVTYYHVKDTNSCD